MTQEYTCPVCQAKAEKELDHNTWAVFWACPTCGRYEVDDKLLRSVDLNHLASYLLYHKFDRDGNHELRYHTYLNKESCDYYREECDKGHNTIGRPVHMDADMIENWYPKTFSEKVDRILLHLYSHSKHLGQWVDLGIHEEIGMLFVDRWDKGIKWELRNPDDVKSEIEYMLECLSQSAYISYSRERPTDYGWDHHIRLTPEGYARVDALQKNNASGRNALVAMKFGDDTIPLREAIRKGVKAAGYNAIFIDEVQHNDFITPELLKYIRDSKFVVADLTHQNNGAYFEEGYAMGLGKPVIQLCKKGVQLHFDIAQKNTIMWETEDAIPERLCNRIKATID